MVLPQPGQHAKGVCVASGVSGMLVVGTMVSGLRNVALSGEAIVTTIVDDMAGLWDGWVGSVAVCCASGGIVGGTKMSELNFGFPLLGLG